MIKNLFYQSKLILLNLLLRNFYNLLVISTVMITNYGYAQSTMPTPSGVANPSAMPTPSGIANPSAMPTPSGVANPSAMPSPSGIPTSAGMPGQPAMAGAYPNIMTSSLNQISGSNISNSISQLLGGGNSFKKVEILMFSNQELSNINRALDSLKNNQIFVPEELNADTKLSEAEIVEQQVKEEEQKKREEIEQNEKSYIYLGSIIYFTNNDWVIWLNDQKITSQNNKEEKEIYIKSISNNNVSVRWRMSISKWKILSGKKDETLAPKISQESNIVESEFNLRPNQTYILGSNNVVEGKAVIALIKKKESSKDELQNKTSNPSASSSSQSNSPSSKASNILSTIQTIQKMNKQMDELNEKQ